MWNRAGVGVSRYLKERFQTRKSYIDPILTRYLPSTMQLRRLVKNPSVRPILSVLEGAG